MTDLGQFSVKIKNFKCFGELEQGFDQIKPVNLIIGRNNSGKSSLLDLISKLVAEDFKFPEELWHGNQPPEIIAEMALEAEALKKVFKEHTSGGTIRINHWSFGQKYLGTMFRWRLDVRRYLAIGESGKGEREIETLQDSAEYLQNLAVAMPNPFSGKEFKRISAERNILPEIDSSTIEVTSNGQGVTNIIQNFINKVHLKNNLIEKTFLNELNEIFKTDAQFNDIVCQQLATGEWEIFLEEEKKGRISLSQSGSGLKTIILVLVYIHLVPVVVKKNLSEFIFAFEELENNLHPALLRRLLSYLYQQTKTTGCIFFLTTHSNVEIDLFNKNEDAQIIHVTHDGKQAHSRMVQTYIDNKGILDDLDVRASDLLQSNGIIWVEGPSDRIYLNRWIALWSEGKLKEGNHYQCVFYGGRLLSHLSSEEPNAVSEGIPILIVNKNVSLLIDSDKKNQQARLNDTKQRIIEEITKNGGVPWVTKGKEIENYIPAEALGKLLDVPLVRQVGQYENFFEYLDGIKEEKGKWYKGRKPLLAEEVCQHITRENISGVLDLEQRLKEICEVIRDWNSL